MEIFSTFHEYFSYLHQLIRFQEKFDVENAIEHVQIDASNDEANTSSKTEPIDMDEDVLIITSTMESIETDDDGLVTDGEREHKSTKRRGYSSCEDCDIPFVTKKQLKVNCVDHPSLKKRVIYLTTI